MLPNLPPFWKTRPFGEVCVLIMGQAPKGDSYNDKGIGVPLIAGAADLGPVTPTPKKWTTSPTKLGQKGDIILCVRATIGDLNWADSEYCYGRGVSGIRAYSHIDPEFLWFWLEACRDHLTNLGRGATFKQISKTDITALPVPDLKLPEQRCVVARIKECMERVEEIEQLQSSVIEEASFLPAAFRYDLWNHYAKSAKMVELGSITESVKNGLYKPRDFHGQGVILLRMFNINGALLNLDRIERLEVSKKELSDYLVTNGDILISRVNSRELVGKSALVEGLEEAAVHEAMLIRLRVYDAKVDKRFLVWLINSPQFLYELRGRAKHAIGQSSINQKDLLSSKIPLPAIEEQRTVVESMSDLSPLGAELVTECAERQEMASRLRESILRKAFAGEL